MALALGQRHTIALRNLGYVWAWGSSLFNALGNNQVDCPCFRVGTPQPVQAIANLTATQVFSTDYNGLALLSNGTIVLWGVGDPMFGLDSGTTYVNPVQLQRGHGREHRL